MNVLNQINTYIDNQSGSKLGEMQELHNMMLKLMPECQLWFLDGKNNAGKIVSNPNIGYGCYTIHYADGNSKPFYQIGLSANTTGISVYIMGIKDKAYLKNTYRFSIGKASVSGYCIRFKSLKDINLKVLEQAIRYGLETSGTNGAD